MNLGNVCFESGRPFMDNKRRHWRETMASDQGFQIPQEYYFLFGKNNRDC